MKVDKRVKSTKEQLYVSFLKLMKEMPIEKITISRLCIEAKINRNTFYTHYGSVEALLGEIEENFGSLVKNEFFQSLDQSYVNSIEGFLEKLLTVVKNNKEIVKLFFSKNGDREFVARILGEIFPMVSTLWSNQNIDKRYLDLAYIYISGGAIRVIEDWVRKDCQDDLVFIASFLNTLITKGPYSIFGQ